MDRRNNKKLRKHQKGACQGKLVYKKNLFYCWIGLNVIEVYNILIILNDLKCSCQI